MIALPRRLAAVALVLLCASGCSAEKEPAAAGFGTTATKSAPGAMPSKAAALAVVDKAIRAHGKDLLSGAWSGRLVVFTRGHISPGVRDEFVTTTTFHFPDRLRESVELTTISGNNKHTGKMTFVRNGAEAWENNDEGPFKSTKDLRSIEDAFPLHLLRDLKAMRDGQFGLQVAGNDTAGQRLLATSVKNEGPPPFEITFDPATGFVTGISTVEYNPQTRRVGKSETHFSDYANFLGAWLPTTMTSYLDGQLFAEKTVKELVALDRVDPAEFQPR